MKILDRERLHDFCRKHADARNWIENWLAEVEAAHWRSPHDVRGHYASASFAGGGLVIFNVKGNAYRLETLIAYGARTVSIEWIGTHAQYDARNKRR